MFKKETRLQVFLRSLCVGEYPKFLFSTVFLIAASFFHFASVAHADTYFNSTEPGCDGSNPDILMCDDFEDGDWAVTNCDTDGGPDNPANDGWCQDIYYGPDPELGKNFGRCGGKGVAGTNCTATTEVRGARAGQMAKHGLVNEPAGVDEIYIRYYIKPLPGFVWGHEKMLTINPPPVRGAGILHGALSSKFGSGRPSFGVRAQDGDPTVSWRDQNQNNTITLSPGPWYYMELHLKLNDPGSLNGIYELWIDDCGADGLGCTGPGTLRSRHTNVMFREASETRNIGSIWFESWGNPASTGESYLDQIVMSKSFVGPMGSTGGGAVCPNGAREGTEECDGADLGGQSCQTLQFDTGTLGCNSNCTFNTSSCQNLADTLSPAAPNGLAIGLAPTPPPTGPFSVSATDNGSTVSVTASLSGGTGPYNFLIDCGNDGNYNGLLNDQTQTSVSYTCTGVGTGAYSVRGFVWDQGADVTHEKTVEVRTN